MTLIKASDQKYKQSVPVPPGPGEQAENHVPNTDTRPNKVEAARLASAHVNYMPPSEGPFMCGMCHFFANTNGGYCQHPEVQAPVESGGCCNEFQSMHSPLKAT